MKNSASNHSQIQALQMQAEQLLPSITHALSNLGYQKAVHQRISQQNDDSEINYQGLTRAQCKPFGQIIIRWQLSLNPQNSAPLNHEIRVAKALNEWQNNQNNTIAPSLLAYNSITITALAQPQELVLLVMPYYPNGSLAQVLKQPLNEQQKHSLIVQAAQLVDSFHQSGWVHGDIKPSNILIEDNLSLLLTDFALAKGVDNSFDNNFNEDRKNSAGTPAYLAPECWQGQSATVQSDIYAFGIMMYEMLMGKRPFAINSQSDDPLQEWALQHCQQPIPILPKQYAHYQMIIDKALAKWLERRYKSMQEVLGSLKRM
ncbi:serine/threonine-protein kinase [Psychrobacter jeotgali]|uniref:serine/threonine-protein kinase n=1 Tax=Psychrobacter jeotgali TaxID=179010 RepID=UPI001919AA67|nr:serine/threonine-protein kinase [Psychrobacter jeotgali]